MKKTLTISIFLLIVLNSFTQNDVFPLDSMRWELYGSSCCPIDTYPIGDMISKRDTVINNKQYKIIGWENNRKDYALRVDTAERVWVIYLDRLLGYGTENDSLYIEEQDRWIYRLTNDSTEHILYDFNVEEGDTIEIFFPAFTYAPNVPDTGGVFSFYTCCPDNVCVNEIDRYAPVFYCISPISESYSNYDIGFSWVKALGARSGGPVFTETTEFFENMPVIISKAYQYGEQIYPCLVGVENGIAESEIRIFPNPFIRTLTIEHERLITSIEIYNVYGGLIYKKKKINKYICSCELFEPDGVYYIRLIDETSSIFTQSIIKSH
jgi:hypothetical protein